MRLSIPTSRTYYDNIINSKRAQPTTSTTKNNKTNNFKELLINSIKISITKLKETKTKTEIKNKIIKPLILKINDITNNIPKNNQNITKKPDIKHIKKVCYYKNIKTDRNTTITNNGSQKSTLKKHLFPIKHNQISIKNLKKTIKNISINNKKSRNGINNKSQNKSLKIKKESKPIIIKKSNLIIDDNINKNKILFDADLENSFNISFSNTNDKNKILDYYNN